MAVPIHVPVRVKDCEDPIGCTCRFGSWFMSVEQFESHVARQRLLERDACPKCWKPLARNKGKGWNRVKVNGRFAHKDCDLDEGRAVAERKRTHKTEAEEAEAARLRDAREHRAAVHLAIARGERLP
jgi:hypothetical protein